MSLQYYETSTVVLIEVTVYSFLFASTLDFQVRWQLADKQIELRISACAPFQLPLCLSGSELGSVWCRACNVRGGPFPRLSQTLRSQPAGAVGPQCAGGLPDSPDLHAHGYRSVCRLLLRRPHSPSHISTHMKSKCQDKLEQCLKKAHLSVNLQVFYDGKVLGRFCGHDNSADGHHPGNHPILSPGNRLTLVFQTDDNNPERRQYVGFVAHYQAIGSTSAALCSASSLCWSVSH